MLLQEQEIQVTCFQSVGSDVMPEKRDIDLFIEPTPTISEHCLKVWHITSFEFLSFSVSSELLHLLLLSH